MKKTLTVVFILAINSFAFYFDAGLGVGGATSEVGNTNIDDACTGCDDYAVNLDIHIGGQINERFWIAGGLEALGHRYEDSYNYIQLNTYLIGPKFIFYPVEHFHLSGSIGLAWTSNMTDVRGLYLYDGTGVALSLTAAFDTGIYNGALIGGSLFTSSVTLEENNKNLSSTGFCVFVAFVHK